MKMNYLITNETLTLTIHKLWIYERFSSVLYFMLLYISVWVKWNSVFSLLSNIIINMIEYQIEFKYDSHGDLRLNYLFIECLILSLLKRRRWKIIIKKEEAKISLKIYFIFGFSEFHVFNRTDKQTTHWNNNDMKQLRWSHYHLLISFGDDHL